MKGRGQILRIDLSSEKISKESMSDELCRNFVDRDFLESVLRELCVCKVENRLAGIFRAWHHGN